MSHWDSSNGVVVEWPPRLAADFPGWAVTDCGCCAGLRWGGESPRECRDCWGNGLRWVHLASGTVAVHPGGPLLGARLRADELARLRERLGETE